MSRARGTVRVEVNVACAVGAPFAAFARGFARGRAARMPLLFFFRRCHVRTAAPLECAAWCRAIGVKSVSLELVF